MQFRDTPTVWLFITITIPVLFLSKVTLFLATVLLCSSVAISLLIQMEKLSFTIFQNRLQIAHRRLFYWSTVAGMYCVVDIIYELHAVLTQGATNKKEIYNRIGKVDTQKKTR
jgi:uncharacterized metal-binding protein